YQLQFTSDGSATPTFTSVSIPYSPSDTTPPPTNASGLAMFRSNGGASVASNGWTNSNPYFTWTAAADDGGGSGILGYCLYLGQDPTGNPITTKGDLGTSPVNTNGACQFAVSGNNIDTALSGYIGTALTSSTSPYYLNIKAIDNADNVYNGSSAQVQFRYDNTAPTNPSFITAPSEFVSSDQVTLTWPTSGGDAADDDSSGVAGLQYRIGSGGTWYGANHSGSQDGSDLLTNNGSYTTVSSPDFANLQQGNNIIYFRTWDNAGNSSPAYVTTVIKINSTAPSSPQNLTATPSTNTTNSFAFSWLAPSTFTGSASNITYCYTVNVLPTSSNCTFTTAGQTGLDAGAYATEPGDNTLYLVAKDEAGNINYATAASTTFTANTPAPGVPLNLDIADISVKTTSNWKLALSWEPPTNIGAGVSTYKIFRSTNNINFTDVASTGGTSYVDANLSQQTYYYKVEACDSANNCGAQTSVVSLLPTGKFTSPANLLNGPTSTVSTRTATISWITDRVSDSRIEYGTTPGKYSATEAANSSQIVSHSLTLSDLQAGTTYYYRAQWDDVDGNIGTSDEQSFTTLPAPTVSGVNVSNINLTNATVQFTSNGASSVKLDYGTSSSFGSVQTLNTSTSSSAYTVNLTHLNSGSTYYFKLDTTDAFGNNYSGGQVNSFITPPQPVVTNVAFQPVPGALTGTEQISWTTNVPTTSQISYGLLNGARQNQLDTTMTTDHTMTISDLSYNTQYSVTATSVDSLGNAASSDQQVFKSGIDTRPPRVSDVTIQPSIVGNGASAKGQLVVSWKTDKAGTSQVAYGQSGSGDYSTKTAENTALVNNHVVVVSGLSTSQVYHIQVISKDAEGIKGVSGDQTSIIGQASDNALSIVFNALQSIFGL
ncbi:MAG TPA: fibronectin type III domain-containing protein, partial [Candidatus Saccharimonadales bacterium]